MTHAIDIAGWFLFTLVALTAGAVVLTSALERRWRPVALATLTFVPILLFLILVQLSDTPTARWITGGALAVGGIGLVAIVIPLGGRPKLHIPGPQARIDERDGIFHRFYRLRPGTTEYEDYYRDHPEQASVDEKIRALPQLGHPGSRAYGAFTAPFQSAISDVLDRATRDVDGRPDPVEGAPLQASPREFTQRIKGFARHLGADLVGTTSLDPTHVYSHIGRSPGPWGAPIEMTHTNAIAIAVEMDFEMVRHAPESPTVTETMKQYFEAAKIAMCVARYINLLGYEARAHVDGNYRVLCVPIAVDAGLGELGRLGLLMTPQYGPRVRLAIVTTDLPLTQDAPLTFGVQHFCDFCKKCSDGCPSAAIDSGEKTLHKGVEKWKTDQQRCYRFWRIQGTDCAACMRVCPYAHPASPLHNAARWFIRRNAIARRLALLADDFLYGRRPKDNKAFPDWHRTAN